MIRLTTAAFAALPLAVPGAAAAQVRVFDVPSGMLIQSIVSLGRQAGVTIITAEPDAARIKVPAVRRAPTLKVALETMLRGTKFEAVQMGPSTFMVRRSQDRTLPRSKVEPSRGDQAGPDIVVTATKQGQSLSTFAGTAYVTATDVAGVRNREGQGSQAIVDQLPVIASTGLGAGRDKLFVRGIADSSFAGPTQATIAEYLGEARVNYNAPDPSLALYDMASVELLVGPQATLYGAGSLGGVLRLVPRRPEMGRLRGDLQSSVSIDGNGRLGSDLAGVLNVPLGGRAAARVVGYTGTSPGIVDDLQRARKAVGRSRTSGGRATVAVDLGDRWSAEVMGVHQSIDHSDARYAEGEGNPPARRSAMAQPASNAFSLAALTFRRKWGGGLELVSATAVVRNALSARYDLSSLSPGIWNDSRNVVTVASHETRLSRTGKQGAGWLVGVHTMTSVDRLSTGLRSRSDDVSRLDIGTRVVDAGLFGQVTTIVSPRWSATLGMRLSYSEVSSTSPPLASLDEEKFSVLRGGTLRALPSAALGWRPRDGVIGYIRYQRGYRVGGLSINAFLNSAQPQLPSFDVKTFQPDTLDMVEIGTRISDPNSLVTGTLAISGTRWANIQADLFDTFGPYTINAGTGHIYGLEASALWRVSPKLRISQAIFVAEAALDREAGTRLLRRETLPNIPRLTARLGMDWLHPLRGDTDLNLYARSRYVGRSRLGVGPDLNIEQGDYFDTSVGAEVTRAGSSLFLGIDNLFDSRASRFALGNPFTAIAGNQRIPLAPIKLQTGIRTTF